jgi:hypothetical protein
MNQACCDANSNPNLSDGNGYLEFSPACLNGGLHCIDNTGCRYCYSPVLGSTNVGNRPICKKNIVHIKNVNSGRYATVAGGSLANGGDVIQFNNPAAPETQWIIQSISLTNRVNIQNVKSGKYMNVQGASMLNGGDVIQWDNPNAPETQWIITPIGLFFNIKNHNSGKYMNVAGGSLANGGNIIQWDNPTSSHSQWVITPV